MERKIGEVFEVDGVKVQCVENINGRDCCDCFFAHLDCLDMPCMDIERIDKQDVIFEELKN